MSQRTVRAMGELPASLALEALDQYAAKRHDTIKNRGAYLFGVIVRAERDQQHPQRPPSPSMSRCTANSPATANTLETCHLLLASPWCSPGTQPLLLLRNFWAFALFAASV